jgi:hypothetical protein
MKPEELIQLLRTTSIGHLRQQMEKDHAEKNIRYDHLVSFILAARELP